MWFNVHVGVFLAIVGVGGTEPCETLAMIAVVDVALGSSFVRYLREVLLAKVFPFRDHHFLQFVLRIGKHCIDFYPCCQCVLQYDFVLAALHILLEMYPAAGADEDVRGGTYIYIAHGTYVRIFVAGGNGFHRSLYEDGVLFVRC